MVGIDCLCCEAVSGLVRPIQFLSNGNHLSSLEVGELDRPPALCGADHGAEHELEDGLLAEGVRNDFYAPALFDEQALEEVCRPDGAAVGGSVGDAGLEVSS